MIALAVATTGVLLLVAGLVALFGAWAAVGFGVVLLVAGVLVDWEVLTDGKPPAPPTL